MADVAWPSDFTEETSPATSRKVMLDGRKFVTLENLGIVTGGAQVLQAWNGSTTAQFNVDQTLPAPGFGGGLTGASFTAATDVSAPGGKKIQISATSMSAFAIGGYWLDGEYDLADIESISVFIGITTPTVGDVFRAGLLFAGDKTVGTAIAWTTGYDAAGALEYVVARADAPGGALLDGNAAGGSGWLTIYMQASRPVTADPPAMGFRWEHFALDGTRTASGLTTALIEAITPWSAAWDTAACNKIGLAIQTGAGGAANPVSVAFTDLRIKRRSA